MRQECVKTLSEQHKSVFFPQGQLVYRPVTHFGYGFRRADFRIFLEESYAKLSIIFNQFLCRDSEA